MTFKSVLIFLSLLIVSSSLFAAPKAVYDFTVKDIKGKDVNLSKYKGKTLLIVNVASKCGYTYQYENLEKVYRKYKEKGFEIVGFPANNFLSQEPGSDAEIEQFCRVKKGATFDMMSKISVKGEDQHPLYTYLTSSAPDPGDVKWNFEKFLISPSGKIVARFRSGTEPDSKEVTDEIEKNLK
ncbi:glutathione peroxidase [Leptospira licerasiae]|uniref:Glutathione peroxidase n=1 Tax=Leptospira licerasiae str. MMD4847 TaxID=1049971 RepID=A0ABP2RDZ5_9LEPT|nr:glutathione peroxidase [Leptospira licerasiae]EID99650.1 glutathione peroxidase [Leptospira licerasiae serovar Varillal str. VAR 010]EJZ41553.1 glutathione peroxidase [Leptospira licerasiae str. MMD4847]